MNEKDGLSRFLFRTPRVLAIVFALFLSIFAFDVFEPGHNAWYYVVAFLIHLWPCLLVLLLLALAWRWEWVGAIGYIALAIVYLVREWGMLDWTAFAVISGPLFLTGALFLWSWLRHRGRRDRRWDKASQ